jgi:hypothetical protein
VWQDAPDLGFLRRAGSIRAGKPPQNLKFQAPRKNPNPNRQNNMRPIEILGLGFVWDLVSWDLGFLA